MNVLDDSMLVYRVAKSYYIDGVSQNEIARQTSISRPQISRMIKKASELGMVKIEVILPESVDISRLCTELKDTLGLKAVYIVPESTKGDSSNFYALAARYLADLLAGCRNVGIGWGRTLYETSLHLSNQSTEKSMAFYPLIGCSGNDNPYLQTNNMIDRFSEKFGAKPCYINIQAISKTDSLTDAQKENLVFLEDHWRQLDAAVVGIAGYELTEQYYISELANDPHITKNKKHFQGDLLANIFLNNGTFLDLSHLSKAACPIEILKRIPNVITIAKGASKVDAIHYVAAGDYIQTLITDQPTARLLLNKR